MIQRDISNFHISDKKERFAVSEVRSFIDHGKALDGFVLILYGLRRTGKTTIMEQAISSYPVDKCAFYEVQDKDSVFDIENVICNSRDRGVEIICFDEVTKANDFITNSSSLADVFAKEGMRILLTGTDSLCFQFATNKELFDRTVRIQTTHIPFAEHCFVLGTNDMDDYIQYGGLMRKGEPEDRVVHDLYSARKYLDSAVSENISRSIKLNPANSCLEKLTIDELKAIIEKMVEIYSGIFSTKNFQDDLKKVTIDLPLRRLTVISGNDATQHARSEYANIIRQFAKIINADIKIHIPVTVKMVEELEKHLLDINVVSMTKNIDFYFMDGFGWNRQNVKRDYYIIQPAVKFNHLQKGKEFYRNTSYYDKLLLIEKEYLEIKLEEKIYGDMLEQIVLYDVSKILSNSGYDVFKPSFFINGEKKAEFDMLIFDKKSKKYWGFEIKHTNHAFYKQEQHLQNQELFEVLDSNYGNKEHVAVLYRGDPFVGGSGTVFLNVNDFLRSISETCDVERSFSYLMQDLPVREVPAKPVENPMEAEIRKQRQNLKIVSLKKSNGFCR